ncbi:energy transducer TonB [Lysobacter auxotrophicus]|uniref:Energy transducer TonB n=1 Tax=Lysobacter auxotrophicus TaxID=2992573 RepID=A0ABM8DHF1_9GAMM|nr:energy transducer TonB [Lysobacter auxotrophicus]BDU18045.1 energy transducer TonB [Lysobacter auxotrophicus]
MSPRLLVMLMIGLSSLQVAAAQKSTDAHKRPAKQAADKRASAKAPTNWLQVEMAGDDGVAALYRDQLLSWYRTSGTMDERELAALPEADYFAFRPDLTSFSIDSGPSAGQWTFAPPDQGRWPGAAVQVIDRSDAANYRILARVHCDAATESCRKLRADTASMAPPEPVTSDESASYDAWRRLIEKEACAPAPKAMPAPRYPASLARHGEGGRVELRLLVNPCGEVRAVRLSGSSGFPQLDQSAIDTAWEWRVQSERQESGAIVRVPVDFVPPQFEAAPGGRAERASR